MVGRSLFLTTSCHPMDNTSARAQLLEHFLSFFLPEGILDYFELCGRRASLSTAGKEYVFTKE